MGFFKRFNPSKNVRAGEVQVKEKQARLEAEIAALRKQMLLESAPDAMLAVNADGKIVMANAHAERLFGYRREEFVGQAVELLVPAQSRDKHTDHRAKYLAQPRSQPIDSRFDLRGLKRTGRSFRSKSP